MFDLQNEFSSHLHYAVALWESYRELLPPQKEEGVFPGIRCSFSVDLRYFGGTINDERGVAKKYEPRSLSLEFDYIFYANSCAQFKWRYLPNITTPEYTELPQNEWILLSGNNTDWYVFEIYVHPLNVLNRASRRLVLHVEEDDRFSNMVRAYIDPKRRTNKFFFPTLVVTKSGVRSGVDTVLELKKWPVQREPAKLIEQNK